MIPNGLMLVHLPRVFMTRKTLEGDILYSFCPQYIFRICVFSSPLSLPALSFLHFDRFLHPSCLDKSQTPPKCIKGQHKSFLQVLPSSAEPKIDDVGRCVFKLPFMQVIKSCCRRRQNCSVSPSLLWTRSNVPG